MEHQLITTGLEIAGYKVTKNLGVVRGLTVRSRSILGNLGAGIQSFIGGNISIYAELCEKTRQEAFDKMTEHAVALGANAIIMARYDANEIASGITEVIAYGTAVMVEKIA